MSLDLEAFVRLSELRAENERLRRIKVLKESFGLNFYRPHYKQHRFHTANTLGRYLRTGNRFGKSETGTAEDLSWCLGYRPWYCEKFDVLNGDRTINFHHDGHREHPFVRVGIPDRPVKGLIIVVDWDMAKRIFTNREGSIDNWGKIFRLLPQDAVGNVHLSRGGHVDQIEIKRPEWLGGGSSILSIDTIQSYKNSKMSAESADWDFIHVDEPCPEKMFKAHARGLMDRNGSYWFNCTPLDEMWINDKFTPPGGKIDDSEGTTFESKTIVAGSIYDNPYRSDSGVAEFESSLTPEERSCRLNGLPLAMAGLIYKEFDHDVHVLKAVPSGWEDYNRPPKNYTIRVWWDYHTRLPQALLFFATDPKGRVFVYDEMFDENMIDPVAKRLQKKLNGYFVADTEIDPFAVIPHPVTGESIVDELMKYDFYFDKATKDLSTGINRVRERLAERDPQGNPTIFFSPRLTNTIWEFSHFIYDLEKNEPKDQHNHMMENLYRAILNELAYMDPPDDGDFVRVQGKIGLDEDLRSFNNPSLK